VLAELSCRDTVPAIWLLSPAVRDERERARWRLHLVRHSTALENRVHATLIGFGKPCPVSDLFGSSGGELVAERGYVYRLPRARSDGSIPSCLGAATLPATSTAARSSSPWAR
jgi:hypothetical protein